MTATTSGVPDLLQRFVPTPYTTALIVDGVKVSLQGNFDFGGIDAESSLTNQQVDTLTATIICDPEPPNASSEITVIKSWPVATVLIGAGTILALDCERAEILGFLDPSVPPSRFVNELLPRLVDLYREMKTSVTANSRQQP